MDDALFTVKQRKAVPHEFMLDAISKSSPVTRPMFGCLAVYIEDKIVFILRDKRDGTPDNGVWLARPRSTMRVSGVSSLACAPFRRLAKL